MKTISAAIKAAIAADHYYCTLMKIKLTPTELLITDCPWDVNPGGEIFKGNGQLLGLDKIKSKTEVEVGTFNIVLAATTSLLSLLLNNNQMNRDVEISRAYLDDDGQIIDAPLPIWSGLITGYKHKSDEKDNVVQLTIASEWADFKKAIGRRTTTNSQQKHFANDKGLEFAAEAGKEYPWGRK